MTSPWKKAKLGGICRLLVSNLRSKARRGSECRESSLVVQVGFPTSLADLVVKNRSRLSKFSRRKKFSARDPDAGSSIASQASEIIAAAAVRMRSDGSPPGSVVGHPLPVVVENNTNGDEISEEFHSQSEALAALAGVEAPKNEVIEVLATAEVRRSEITQALVGTEVRGKKVLEAERNSGFGMVAKVVFLVAILAFCTKKFALGISASAFALLLLELMGKHLLPFLRPCKDPERSLNATVGGVSDLMQLSDGSDSSNSERVPIKLAGIRESDSDSFHSEKRWEVTAVPVSEGKDPVETRGNQKVGTTNHKAKKLLRKFVPRKLRGAKGGKELRSDTSGGGASERKRERDQVIEEDYREEEAAEAKENEDEEEEFVSFNTPIEVSDAGLVSTGENVEGTRKWSSGHVVFFVILVLSGLVVGGRVAALTLTVMWYLLISLAGILRRNWKMHRSWSVL